ncbi:MATE family efflux transporter [Cohnella thailandensis]|uniref:MATE family efflux transporter n=1 Tax=Cohnella thailandensis TaxID=557557 RepID=A0A841T5F6_9BACL|nr:MATE family efflux transporter [Cohnella thailandensis]MBB6638199.1 MATE family efflux transporter [Cohnella thailandensis]MBP1977757.1 putative MATE family efflux protein [Cohnella thailandensis]
MKSLDRKFSLWTLAWPVFIEVLLQTMLGTVDTVMVSRISDDAVAVVGFSNQLFNALTTLFTTIAAGAGILIAQRLGSQRPEDARTLAVMSVTVSTAIGLLISFVLFFESRSIAMLLGLSEELWPLSDTYISYVGGGMFLAAMTAALGTAIRNTGNTRGPMYTGIFINLVHIVLNYGLIFGKIGFPEWGLTGVTVSDNACRLLSVFILLYMFRHSFERTIRLPDYLRFDLKLFKEILRIGWPMGVNMSCWVFSQLAIYSFLAMLGAKELAARTYMNTLESFCFMLGYAFALAVQIRIAYLYGESRTKEAYAAAYRALAFGLLLVLANALLLYLIGRQMLGLFTSDPEIVAMGVSLLGLNLVLQPGKMLNMALGNALNAVGDTRFTMYISLGSLGIIATFCSYWLGVGLGWGLIGIYWCMIADEYVRGALSLWRWRGKKYLNRAESNRVPAGSGHSMPSVSV